MSKVNAIALMEKAESRILTLRGEKVILDSDLAALFGVTTKRLNQQVRRNLQRFPEDFMFQLSWEEARDSRLQFVTLNGDRPRGSRSHIATLNRGSNIKYRPYVFTEHGAIMAANVLNSPRAITASVYVVRAFVKLRQMLAAHKELAHKLTELERRIDKHDDSIQAILSAIRRLMNPPASKPAERIRFRPPARSSSDGTRPEKKSQPHRGRSART